MSRLRIKKYSEKIFIKNKRTILSAVLYMKYENSFIGPYLFDDKRDKLEDLSRHSSLSTK